MPNNPVGRRANRPLPPPASANKVVRGSVLPNAVTQITAVTATPAAPAPPSQPAGTFPSTAANTVLANATTGSAPPAGLAMAASTFLARLASGNIVAATVAQVKTLLAYVIGDLGAIAAGAIVGNNGGVAAAPAALTGAQTAAVIAGSAPFTGTVALAKLTPTTGTDGSLTVVNGLITAYTAPT